MARLLIIAVLFGVLWFIRYQQQRANTIPPPATTSTSSGQQDKPSQAGVPAQVLEVLNFIRRNGQAPEGYVGGKEFLNREKKLPAKAPDGKRIRYSEWDVHPKVNGENRGPDRLVTGSDHSAWYTKNHYKTFIKIE